MESCDECCSFVIFAGRTSVSEGTSDSEDLFDLLDVRVAMVDIVMDSGDGCKKGLVGGDVVSKGDGVSGSTKWRRCSNGGIRTYGWRCGWYVFLVQVIELTGRGLVGVREADASDIGGAIFTDSEEPCDALLDGGVLLLCAY